ncbi:T9SS type A sorting domain-containing protein, partial [Salibacter halophilus]
SKHYISARFSEVNFECVEMLYETIDSSYVAECLQVYPNGILQNQKYNEFVSASNQKVQGASSGTADITYTIENAATTSSNGTSYFEYDIYVSSSTDVYFDNGLVRIQYNTDAFGQNVVGNNKVTAQRGTVTASMGDYYAPSPGDISTDVFAVGVGAELNTYNRYHLTSTPTQLLHVKMEISDCSELPDLQFTDQSTMLTLSLYTNSPGSSNLISFDNITATDTENRDLCTMNITGMAPLQVNGGTGDIVTITGNFFGSTKGTIMMRNTDDGGASWIPLDDYDITQWTDNEIKIRVPSTLPIDATNPNQLKTPGSGKIKVITQSGSSAQTDSTLEVYYSWKNGFTLNFSKSKVFLAGIDSVYDENSTNQQLGYSLIPNPNIVNNSNALGCVRKAIDDWICATEIRWQLDDSSYALPDVRDTNSSIRFGQTEASHVLGETSVWYLNCSDPNNNPMGYNPDIDITLSNAPNHNWFYDSTGTQPQPAGKFDFYSVILHELGHGHLLMHVNQTDDLMYWEAKHSPNNSLPWNERMTYFSLANLDGGQAIVNESQSVNFSFCNGQNHTMVPLQKQNCSVALYTDKLKEPRETDLTAYPNPFERFAKLEFELERQANVGLKLYSLDGRLVRSKPGQQYSSGKHRIEINGNDLHSGLYIAILAIGSNEYPVKLIKR